MKGLQKRSAIGAIDLNQGLGAVVAPPKLSNYIKILTPNKKLRIKTF